MIKYVTLGTNDIEKARAFYTPLFEAMGGKELFDNGRLYFYGTDMANPMIAVGGTYNAEAATFGNGTMVAIDGGDEENINRLYTKAIELGATDDGPPGQRMPIFYGAYVRDADGNKLCFCKFG